MRLVWVVIPILLIVSMIGIVGMQESFATEPCFLHAPFHWDAYNDIYTGKVVSIVNQTNDVRINFELEHLLKGNPPFIWHKVVPFETVEGFPHPAYGANYYTIGSEIFYIENYSGVGSGDTGGYCGIGEAKINLSLEYGGFNDFFNYYEELYKRPVPKKMECGDNHVSVLRDNGKFACVSENTADKKEWVIISTESTSSQINYKFPLLLQYFKNEEIDESKIWLSDFDVVVSDLPKIGETAIIKVIVINQSPFKLSELYPDATIEIKISDNFEFVDVPSENITVSDDHRYSSYGKKLDLRPSYNYKVYGNLFATIKAVKIGEGYIGGSLSPVYNSTSLVYVDKYQTLLLQDYYDQNSKTQSPFESLTK